MSFQRLPNFPVLHFGHSIPMVEVIPYALTRIKSGLLTGTISAWQINEGTGTVVGDAVGVNDGTIFGALWTTTAKSGGYALDFDGVDDYVNIPHDPSLGGMSELTVELWFISDLTTPTSRRLFTKYGAAYSDRVFLIGFDGDGYLEFGVWSPTGMSLSKYSVSLTVGEWYHLVGTWNEVDHIKVYLNKTLLTPYSVIDTAATAPLYTGTLHALIGANEYNGVIEFWDGIIDESRLYDRALTADEISERYDYGLKIRVTGMTEGMKAELYDTADVLKASYTLGVGETQAVLDVSALTFPFSGYFKIYDATTALLLKSDVFTDIWGGDVYEFGVV